MPMRLRCHSQSSKKKPQLLPLSPDSNAWTAHITQTSAKLYSFLLTLNTHQQRDPPNALYRAT